MTILYAPRHKTRRGRPKTKTQPQNNQRPSSSQGICKTSSLEQLVLCGLISSTDADIGYAFERLRSQVGRLMNAPRLVRQTANPACIREQRGQKTDTPETEHERRLLLKWSQMNKRLQEWGEDYFLLLEWSLIPRQPLDKRHLIHVAKLLLPLLQDLAHISVYGTKPTTHTLRT